MQRIGFVFTCNIRRSVFDRFGLNFFKHLRNRKFSNSTNLSLLPIVNSLNDNIEKRAQNIAKQLPALMSQLQLDKVHLISYSASGLDARFALSKLNLHEKCLSLTTISTPHQGAKSSLYSQRKMFKEDVIDPIARLIGIGIKPFHQFTSERMKYFNQSVTNVPTIKYFSIGAERLPVNANPCFFKLGNFLRLQTQPNFVYENDGVFGHDQITWGKHLVNFEADHSQIVGVTPNPQGKHVFQLINDNLASQFKGEESTIEEIALKKEVVL